ncbi:MULTISPECIES: FKBP-type peptidyl-prolyl cis-trans isomerase [Olivibacter]|jgi:FKBP-type peptidyl-prolyl cis-trans isomerase FkpA|uniref:Peptidyl-prolyl cis-trans isomerase n=2 Tax=Olivibacter TaxID=376469 RepID=A0ABV6HSI6_9SPHI|nr:MULTISPECIES: FKBP-type peptidyl-prolyl cis-trans isomerase [Olivibacter]MCL4639376.1 FKBP-type peptidyl-prolyl cis-trans isomerase [Olivibacter sp. UJ_SKK_5.1]MDM8174404.1 FKBP-type peptidyl-prolyl cis-trans isomerase [Olivibacter sp. 47]MDX3916659.1 FKBP-type peptidyl-prolyl cis-trans isomerase [Pseudosphingobacterium sp.]QEL01277.1 peptidylprolyl isomerase [Olivibacter sp. LS-1]
MKHTNKILFLLFGVLIAFSACNKTDFDEIRREQERQDSIRQARIRKVLAEQEPILRAYVQDPDNGWTNPRRSDSTGIWYEVLEPGQSDSYTYKLNSIGQIVAPTIEVKYKGQLLNGTVFDQTSDSLANKKTFKTNLGSNIIPAWVYAFIPSSFTYNGQNMPTFGLTSSGLKKGSKIRFVTPSPWGYDDKANEKIPANSPLVFEIEVVDINDNL